MNHSRSSNNQQRDGSSSEDPRTAAQQLGKALDARTESETLSSARAHLTHSARGTQAGTPCAHHTLIGTTDEHQTSPKGMTGIRKAQLETSPAELQRSLAMPH